MNIIILSSASLKNFKLNKFEFFNKPDVTFQIGINLKGNPNLGSVLKIKPCYKNPKTYAEIASNENWCDWSNFLQMPTRNHFLKFIPNSYFKNIILHDTSKKDKRKKLNYYKYETSTFLLDFVSKFYFPDEIICLEHFDHSDYYDEIYFIIS